MYLKEGLLIVGLLAFGAAWAMSTFTKGYWDKLITIGVLVIACGTALGINLVQAVKEMDELGYHHSISLCLMIAFAIGAGTHRSLGPKLAWSAAGLVLVLSILVGALAYVPS